MRLTVLFCLLFPLAQAGDEDWTTQLYQHYQARKPLAHPFSGTAQEALIAQAAFLAQLESSLGRVVGYKAALTSRPARKRFGVTEPLRGTLLQGMLLKSGATLSRNFGARVLFEGDLVVRVGNKALNEAKTHGEVIAALDGVFPFLELPDLVFAADVPLNGPALTAVNAGARFGVLGEMVALDGAEAWINRLAQIKVTLRDEQDQVLAEGSSQALMGHPLDAVLWLRDSLHKNGIHLKQGDLLSLGSITRLLPVGSTTAVTATYGGLDPNGVRTVTVHFTD